MKNYFLLISIILILSCNSNSRQATPQKTTPDKITPPTSEVPTQQPSAFETEFYKQHGDKVREKTVAINTMNGTTEMDLGAGTIVKKGNTLYLLTCYHVVPGYNAGDTTLVMNNHPAAPDKIKVFFHGKNKVIPVIYDLYDSKHNRLFYTCQMPDVVMNETNPKSKIDISFMPLGKLSNEIIIDPISLADTSNYLPKTDDIISVWGYRFELRSDTLEHCIVDTAKVAKQTYLKNNGATIAISVHKSFEGNSGAPAYILKDGKLVFVGIEASSLVWDGYAQSLFADNTLNQQIAVIITKPVLNYALNTFVP